MELSASGWCLGLHALNEDKCLSKRESTVAPMRPNSNQQVITVGVLQVFLFVCFVLFFNNPRDCKQSKGYRMCHGTAQELTLR